MKKVKLDYRHSGDHRWKQLQSRSIIVFLKTMLKLENITFLVLIVLAHQIQGIYSQGKSTKNTQLSNAYTKNFVLWVMLS